MIDYNEFMRRYSNKIIGKLNEYEYEALFHHVSDIVNESIDYNGFYEIDSNKCIEAIMLYLLSKTSFDQILYTNYDDVIENAVIKFKERFYDKKVNKTQSNSMHTSNYSKKQMCINYIKDIIFEAKDIFDNNTDFGLLSINIYDGLMADDISEDTILSGKGDFKILECIRKLSSTSYVIFTEDFNKLYYNVYNYTTNIFEKNKRVLNPNLNNEKYYLYSNINILHEVAFKASVAFKLMNYSYDNIDYAKLNKFISNDTNRIMIENSSIISKSRKEVLITKANYTNAYDRGVKEEVDSKNKKKKIIIGIIVALFILENLGYKLVETYKENESKNKEKYQTEYSVSDSEFKHKTGAEAIVEYYNQKR